MTPNQAQAVKLRDSGMPRRQIAAEMGMSESAVKALLERAKKWGPGVDAALARLGVEGAVTRGGWLKDKGASIRFDVPKGEADPQAWVDAIREGLADLPRPGAIAGLTGDDALCAVFPVADLHIGMLADAEEVGQNWDTKLAQETFTRIFGRLVDVTPGAGVAILAQLGDLSHVDDQRNVTPQSGHQLDADTRFFQILRRSVAVMKYAIERLREKYPLVIYRGTRGNHDLTVHYAVTLALSEAYANVPGVQIIGSAHEFYVHEFGRNMLVLHHGDRVKADRLAHFAAAEWPEVWGRTRYRLGLSGHVHHARRVEIGGMALESVGTIIPRDAHAVSSGYSANRCLVSITLDKDAGEISRARVAV